jgi:hypothetical protein
MTSNLFTLLNTRSPINLTAYFTADVTYYLRVLHVLLIDSLRFIYFLNIDNVLVLHLFTSDNLRFLHFLDSDNVLYISSILTI